MATQEYVEEDTVESDEKAPENPGFLTSLSRKDLERLLAGGIAGSLACLVGHPFDSVKVRAQIHNKGNVRVFSIMKEMFLKEGFRSFFRGAIPPSTMKFLTTSQFFFLNGYMKDRWTERKRRLQGLSRDDEIILSLSEVSIMAAISGCLLAPVMTPSEQIKVLLQSDKVFRGTDDKTGIARQRPTYRGIFHALQVVIKQRALMRGYAATSLRLIPGWGVLSPLLTICNVAHGNFSPLSLFHKGIYSLMKVIIVCLTVTPP